MSPMEYLLTLASACRSRRAYVLAACTGLQPLYHRVTTPTAPPSSAYSAIEICHTAFLYPLPRQVVMTRQYLPTSARYLTGCLVHHQAGLVYQNQNNCNGSFTSEQTSKHNHPKHQQLLYVRTTQLDLHDRILNPTRFDFKTLSPVHEHCKLALLQRRAFTLEHAQLS
ncbi:uncharacterized protein SEPMUDRAFT_149894 [Sphaerulina musiva SO2202]|uniref:Uncharacterized protein n=1 Tax=Sphaerulina musiva (strain SO2202) TaxID=692275 RepID=N1QFQ1_SPHMS|nr:uncharacterized protein SEPMUDRAFT_149894 [Sphaerulina musiva SO2202]EMF12133.1 hypothetical protein SEPMUDRAFT_149894 [Sphaerulina musiva SO2202]